MVTANEINYEEEYVVNSRGLRMFTCRWFPANSEPKALIFLPWLRDGVQRLLQRCPFFFPMTVQIWKKSNMKRRRAGCATRLVKAGYDVYGVDCEGHGKTAGLQGYIPCFDDVVDDLSDYFTTISEKRENRRKTRFLLGESMGGATALRLHRKKPEYWDGAILIAPMCKIADDVKPSPLVISVLTKLSRVVPTWRLTPTPDIIDLAFRDPEVRKEIRSNPYTYKGWPRLKTANELLNVSSDLEKRLNEVNLPFIVLHGEEDKVTSLSVSQELFKLAISSDKTFKSYPGMWHSLSYGELPENIDVVFSDIVQWLHERVSSKNDILKEQQKLGDEDHCDKA